jgi:O-antigen/teichoic acid export membrane protein
LPLLLPPDKQHLLSVAFLFLLFIPLNHLALNLQGIDHGRGNFKWLNLTRAALYPIFFSGLVLTWWYAQDLVLWVICSLLVANGCVVFLRLVSKHESFTSLELALSSETLLKESFPFILASVVAIIYMQIDKAVLIWILPREEIGWYVAAFAAAGVVNVLSNSLGIVQFSEAVQNEAGLGFASLACVLRRSGIISSASAIGLAALLPWLLPLVYGEAFTPAVGIAGILLPGMVIAGLAEICNQALRGQGKPLAGMVSKFMGILVMGCSAYVLAKLWGGKGIACGYLFGQLVAFAGILAISIRYFKDAVVSDLYPKFSDVEAVWKGFCKSR